ncbi:DNA mismatch repair protein [Mucilaginibacter corticis]|uniref:DNA mismatch repair protein n=1 Tax=Mucilaginibacter corticis TaxID=2597670 RepID=A0A556M958_9SPHI|nr:DNA mismatch repair protein [Mucilaginibacter corticis]TSJ36418.1 DNA mismatch repair protein [Mucilaginibacter corticis]
MNKTFFADKQTLEDLNIPGRHKNNSIARIFDKVVTAGGRKLMDTMFQSPLTNADEINQRSGIFKYFTGKAFQFPFTESEFSVMENYLGLGSGSNKVTVGLGILSKKVMQAAAQDTQYEHLNKDICKTIDVLNRFHDFMGRFDDKGSPYSSQIAQIGHIYNNPKLKWLKQEQGVKVLPLFKLIRYDHLLRTGLHAEMKQLTGLIFQLDVYIAVAAVACAKGLSFALALPKDKNVLTVKGVFHPAIDHAVGNSIAFDREANVVFLTGANMAGKSTLMKSFGISIYLAHMGFPVAATFMEFSVKDGLYSSINVPDNLDLGYSHFYAEVLRVKKVAEEVAAEKDLVVIFDELFKGTNVKDAYDATLAITEAFSENRNCFFVISTHIIEVGETLRERCSNFRFTYLPTVMDGLVPQYTYRLTEGITTDRHGMMIIENEGILDIIRGN